MVFLVSSCRVRFDDKPTALSAKIVSGNCLSNLPDLANSYLDGSAQPTEIRKATSCLVNALEEFNYISKGNSFYASDLVSFINRKVLGENKISKNLTSELMKLKVLFVGGTSEFVEADDYLKLLEFIRFIEKQALANLDFVKIYRKDLSAAELQDFDLKKLDRAKKQLEKSAMEFAAWLHGSGLSYDFKSLEMLIREMRKLLNLQTISEDRDRIDYWIALIRAYKKTQVAGADNFIEPQHWKQLFSGAVELYGAYLEASYFIFNKNVYYGRGFKSLINIFDTIFKYINNSIQVQSDKILKYNDVEALLISLQNLAYIPQHINIKKHLSPLIQHLNEHMLRAPGEVIKSTGFSNSNLNQLAYEFRVWSRAQENLISMKDYADANNIDHDMKLVAQHFKAKNLKLNASVDYMLKALPLDIQYGFRDNRLRINNKNIITITSFNDLSVLNFYKGIARLFVRATALETEDFSNLAGIKVTEAEKLYEVSYGLIADLGLLKVKDNEFIAKTFKEASVFTRVGTGFSENIQLRLPQIIEHIALIGSGLRTKSELSKALKSSPLGAQDYVLKYYVSIFKNLPALVKSLSSMTDDDRASFFDIIWDISFGACNDKSKATSVELIRFSTLIHYIETIYTTYDLNSNGELDENELLSSFPRFQYILEKEIVKRGHGEQSVGMQKSIFAYLVSKGKIPNTASFGNIVELKWWHWRYFDDDIHQYTKDLKADAPEIRIHRQEIAKVFHFLNSDAAAKDCSF